MKLKISVVTVSYNAVSTIEDTIKSVVNQTYDNIEYIIIDGGSTDGTVDIIKKYSDKISYWISEPDKGIYDAMNKGILAATGCYVCFIGADDTFFSNTSLSDVEEKLDIQANCIYYGDVKLRPSGKVYDRNFSLFKLIRKNICHQAIFYPTSLLKNHRYSLKYKAYSDYYQNILFWGMGIKFKYVPITIANFTIGGFSLKGDKDFMDDRGGIVFKNLGLIPYVYYLLRVKLVNALKRIL